MSERYIETLFDTLTEDLQALTDGYATALTDDQRSIFLHAIDCTERSLHDLELLKISHAS